MAKVCVHLGFTFRVGSLDTNQYRPSYYSTIGRGWHGFGICVGAST